MTDEVLIRRGTTLVRRLRLAPGETTPWHRDPYHRVSVVLSGDVIAIEFRDGGEPERIELTPGQADWDEPFARLHRAVNIGTQVYEEVTTFLLDKPDAVPQPQESP
jgi:hypothetical protein